MKYLLLLTLIFIARYTSAQFNPLKPNLRQGNFFTEDSAAYILQNIATKYNDKSSWEKRAALIRQGIFDGAEINGISKRKPFKSKVRSLKIFDGYTVSNVYLEGIEGIYITGNLYRPLKHKGKMAGVLCPHGHGVSPRFAEYTQQRCATLARMGAIVFAYDMSGMGEATQCDHKIDKAFKLQLINGTYALDFMCSIPDVDTTRIGMTGESGGGTQTFMLAAIDSRIKVSVPVVMVSAHFFGGCVCESGMPVHVRASHETSNVEIAALFAPKPMLLISDGNDWTKNTPRSEFPFIQKVYSFYGVSNSVENIHLANEGHDYGISKRRAMYAFMAKNLKLNLNKVLKDNKIDESTNTILSPIQLSVFDTANARPSNAVVGNEAMMNTLNQNWLKE